MHFLNEEPKNDYWLISDKIAEAEDINALFLLEDNEYFTITLHKILCNRYEKSPGALNQVELNLFLAIHLENVGQSDTLLTVLQEWFSQYAGTVVESLVEIGAVKSAEIIKQAVDLLPEDGSWFFEKASEMESDLMCKLDTAFALYPDGNINILYRRYAEENRDKLVKNQQILF